MTEGIIQQWFRKTALDQHCINIALINEDNIKELIEEIKHYLNDREQYNTGLRNYLIGDNQE